ncbi:FAD-dependent oxidoreductase [Dehalobacter sp. DCM]|uniref:FAD-dependent oxidoreductase n=1 Tax=Dehalobacter sp. DCM TaxID=2907827 RepID=UPI0030815618|nr:FAD-dependent oxidoreductase [Dehalobacter sp. DCM]
MKRKTIIVGGGMAAMSCALRLMERGEDFLLVTEVLGGRVMYSSHEDVNYGAYFVMSNYRHAKNIVEKNGRINPLDACFHNNERERFSTLSWHTLASLPQFLKFLSALLEFRKHYEAYKQRCLENPQKEALADDPYLKRLFHLPAGDFIKEKKFEKVTADYVSKFAYACTGADINTITTMDFLNVSLGLVLPIHQIKFDSEAMAAKLGDHLVFDTITDIVKGTDGYTLTGSTGTTFEAKNIVVATPAAVTQKLLNLSEIREACRIYVYHVAATLKPEFRKRGLNLFPATSEFILIAKQKDGTYLIYSRENDVNLSKLCLKCEMIGYKDWDKAMYVYGRAYMEQELEKGLYIAGDHNGLGLEPTSISGIYAANKIIQSNC